MNEILQQVGNLIVNTEYRFDPETEDLLYSNELTEGMVVLAMESERVHNSPHQEPSYRILMKNRWCSVTKLRTQDDGQVVFVGLYSDGMKAVRVSGPYTGWHVKIDQNVNDFGDPVESGPSEPRSTFQNYMQAGN